jgi:hypothetical protein
MSAWSTPVDGRPRVRCPDQWRTVDQPRHHGRGRECRQFWHLMFPRQEYVGRMPREKVTGLQAVSDWTVQTGSPFGKET